jgi:hypothetical protein
MTFNTNYIELDGHFFHFIHYSSTQEILKEQITIQDLLFKTTLKTTAQNMTYDRPSHMFRLKSLQLYTLVTYGH